MGVEMIGRILIICLLLPTILISQKKYSLQCDERLIIESRKVMFEQLGTLEQGSNRGDMIIKYLASVRLEPGSPYCAAGQYWCFAEACRLIEINQSAVPLPKTGLAGNFYSFAKRKGKPIRFSPAVDDLIIWRIPSSIHGHVERIIDIDRGGWLTTIGFNTSRKIGGKRVEGVFSHRRNIYHPMRRMYVKGLIGFNAGGRNDT